MKELIGCSKLIHELLHDYLCTEWWFRKCSRVNIAQGPFKKFVFQ